jgi:hypothetical protein
MVSADSWPFADVKPAISHERSIRPDTLRRMNYRSLLFLSMLLLTSCATITRGVHEKLKVQSNPSGAAVTLSTGEKGVTPATFVEKRRHDTFTVTVSKPGYVSETVTVQSKAGGTGGTAMAGNLILGGAIKDSLGWFNRSG